MKKLIIYLKRIYADNELALQVLALFIFCLFIIAYTRLELVSILGRFSMLVWLIFSLYFLNVHAYLKIAVMLKDYCPNNKARVFILVCLVVLQAVVLAQLSVFLKGLILV